MTELCEDLTNYGNNITAIAGRSSYIKDDSGVYFFKKHTYKSINIIRTGGSALPKQFLLGRIINLAFYFIFAFISGFTIKNKPQVVITQSDPPLICLIGLFFAKYYNAKFIYYIADIYPDVGIVTGKLKNPIINFLLSKANQVAFKNADKIICLGDSMKKKIVDKGVNEDKIEVVHNWADTKILHPIKKAENSFIKKNNLSNKFIVMYSGNIGLTQNLENVVKAAKELQENKDIIFAFIGEGASKENLVKTIKKENVTNIRFFPYQPKEELKYSLSAADIHLVPFHKGLKGVLVPCKIYGILACGKPFISWVEKETEIYDIAHKYKCGLIIPPDNIRNLIRAIKWAHKNQNRLQEMSQRGVDTATKYFDRSISTKKINEIILSA